MASYKVEHNKRGELVGRIYVSTKDIETGKNKVITKRIYNEKKLTDAKFEKLLEKTAIEFENDIINQYEEGREQIRTKVLTFSELSKEFLENLKKNLSISYYIKAKKSIQLFNDYLVKIHFDKESIEQIKVRDVQMFFNSFTTYDSAPQGLVVLKKEFPKTVNRRLMAKEGIIL